MILLVEDDDSVRQLATTVLTEAGYSVLSAPDGVEALRLVAEPSQKIDLLFTDMAMPEMDGTQLAELVTQLRPGIRVLKMSGYISDPATRKQISEENVGFIQKPFSPRDLVLKVMSLFPFDTVNNARR